MDVPQMNQTVWMSSVHSSKPRRPWPEPPYYKRSGFDVILTVSHAFTIYCTERRSMR